MFRRTFWFTTGAATGVWATLRVQRTIRAFSPENVAAGIAAGAANRAIGTGRRAVLFARDVRSAMAEREGLLNDALGRTPGGRPAELPGQRAKAQLERERPYDRNHDPKEDH